MVQIVLFTSHVQVAGLKAPRTIMATAVATRPTWFALNFLSHQRTIRLCLVVRPLFDRDKPLIMRLVFASLWRKAYSGGKTDTQRASRCKRSSASTNYVYAGSRCDFLPAH